uniref:gamma-glutamylcyclotransferase n=1 Tax=Glossina brevipalpis TaxID=37001 RepID=A0A1A9W3E1_9MUSC
MFTILFILSASMQNLNANQINGNGKNDTNNDNNTLTEVDGHKFYYFGYGSNMLTKRIHLQNPTAIKVGPGQLRDYRLDFNTYTERWEGAPATVVPHPNRTVLGTLWEIDLINLNNLDKQEGVPQGIYKPLSLPIAHHPDQVTVARVYVLVNQPSMDLQQMQSYDIPFDRQPSKTYLKCLIKGAIETGLNDDYVNWLKSIKHNDHRTREAEAIRSVIANQTREVLPPASERNRQRMTEVHVEVASIAIAFCSFRSVIS